MSKLELLEQINTNLNFISLMLCAIVGLLLAILFSE
jgi:hypothetical protein